MPDGIDPSLFGLGARYQGWSDCKARSRISGAQAGFIRRNCKMAKSIFERLSGEYEQQEDYLIPRLTVPAEEEHSIGIWGQQHLDYLKQCHKFLKDFTIRIAADAIRCSLSLWTSRKSHFGKDIFFRQVKLNIFLSFFLIRCHA